MSIRYFRQISSIVIMLFIVLIQPVSVLAEQRFRIDGNSVTNTYSPNQEITQTLTVPGANRLMLLFPHYLESGETLTLRDANGSIIQNRNGGASTEVCLANIVGPTISITFKADSDDITDSVFEIVIDDQDNPHESNIHEIENYELANDAVRECKAWILSLEDAKRLLVVYPHQMNGSRIDMWDAAGGKISYCTAFTTEIARIVTGKIVAVSFQAYDYHRDNIRFSVGIIDPDNADSWPVVGFGHPDGWGMASDVRFIARAGADSITVTTTASVAKGDYVSLWGTEGNRIRSAVGVSNISGTFPSQGGVCATAYLRNPSASVGTAFEVSVNKVEDGLPPGSPSVIGPVIATETRPTWTWTSGGKGSGWYRYALSAEELTSAEERRVSSYMPANGLPDGEYTLFVQERDYSNHWSDPGQHSVLIDTHPPSQPSAMMDNPETTRSATPKISWVAVADATAYRIIVADNSAFNDPYIDTTTTKTSFTFFPALSDHGIWYWQVVAQDAAGQESTGLTGVMEFLSVSMPWIPLLLD